MGALVGTARTGLGAALVSGGLIKQGTDYARCVDTTLAIAAVADDPPSM